MILLAIFVVLSFSFAPNTVNSAPQVCEQTAGDTKLQVCLQGNCTFDCVTNRTRGSCEQLCLQAGGCTSMICSGKTCSQKCTENCTRMECSAETCVLTCSGGRCTGMTCSTSVQSCTIECPGGNCEMNCDAKVCDVKPCAGCSYSGSGLNPTSGGKSTVNGVSALFMLMSAGIMSLQL